MSEFCGNCEKLSDENDMLIEAIEDMCYQFGGWRNGCLHHQFLSALENAFGILGWNPEHPVPEMTCDETGCNKQVSCGGSRSTCSEHHKPSGDTT